MQKERAITVNFQFFHQVAVGVFEGRVLLDAAAGVAGDINDATWVFGKRGAMKNHQGV